MKLYTDNNKHVVNYVERTKYNSFGEGKNIFLVLYEIHILFCLNT